MNEGYFQLPSWDGSFNMNSPAPMNIPSLDFGNSGSSVATAGDIGAITGAGGSVGGYQPLDFGFNLPTAQLGLQGLSTLGNLWGSLQSTKLAKDAFNFQKGMAEKNYANSIKSYNTALTDRATSRGFVQGDSAAQTQQYIDQNKL